MKNVIEKLIDRQDLSAAEMEQAFELIMTGQVSDVQIGAFLVALRAKGETPEEIAAAAKIMRAKAVAVPVDFEVVDTCGTGGDALHTFNISTAVAFVLAGAGCKVAKHGNRSVSSSSGSADCLEALGVPITLGPQEAAAAIRDTGFAFLFAPSYHPSMKYAMPARKQLATKTVFNILGPLSNPAGAARQLMGVYSAGLTKPIAEVLGLLGLKSALVVNSGMDEVAIDRPTVYARLQDGRVTTGEITPEAAGISLGDMAALKVETARQSAEIIEQVFTGERTDACLDAVLINAGAAFMAVGLADDIRSGVDKARSVIGQGRALEALNCARGK